MSPVLAEEWENHSLQCHSCFEEIRAAEQPIRALGEPVAQRKQVDGVTVLDFSRTTQLLAATIELTALEKPFTWRKTQSF